MRELPLVRVLGPVGVWDGRVVAPVVGQQGLLLSALCAGYPEVVSRDHLAEQIWPDRQPDDARRAMAVLVHRLRGRLGDPARIITVGRSYRLAIEPHELDQTLLERESTEGARLISFCPSDAVERLVDALSIWRGRPYHPYESQQSLVIATAHLDEVRHQAEESLVDALLAAGRTPEAASAAGQHAMAQPYRERRWEQLMVARYRNGCHADALQAANDARRILRVDLGLEPGPRLRTLERAILDHDQSVLAAHVCGAI